MDGRSIFGRARYDQFLRIGLRRCAAARRSSAGSSPPSSSPSSAPSFVTSFKQNPKGGAGGKSRGRDIATELYLARSRSRPLLFRPLNTEQTHSKVFGTRENIFFFVPPLALLGFDNFLQFLVTSLLF